MQFMFYLCYFSSCSSRTSPISVPGSRQRQESTSSNGSWQVVTDTGSIDSTMNGSYMMRFVSQQNQQGQDNNIPMCNGSGNGYHPNGSGSSNSSSNTTHGFANGSSNNMGNGSSTSIKQSIQV